MPIFAPKKKEVVEVPEKIPEVPTAEELREIAGKLREWPAGAKADETLERLKKISKVMVEKPEAVPIGELREIVKKVEEVPKVEEKPELKVEEKAPPERLVGPPLFIKLERYYRILRYISELRRTLFMTKSITSTLTDIEKLRKENVDLLQKTIERIDKKLADLDRELLRPKELPEYPEEVTEARGVETVLTDLKGQLQSLKEELETIS